MKSLLPDWWPSDDKPYKIIDCYEGLKLLPDNVLDCVVTSPPYWGLRDYGTGGKEWHDGWIGELGLEPTPDIFVSHLCDIFDEVKRSMKDTGTCWVNLGDTYFGKPKSSDGTKDSAHGYENRGKIYKEMRGTIPEKSLVMIPSRFAIEMVNRGWVLRNTIIWHKCLYSKTDIFIIDRMGNFRRKKVSEVVIGDVVPSIDKDGNQVWVEVVDKVYSGEKELYRIELTNGKSIIASGDHRFPTSSNWRDSDIGFMKLKLKSVLELTDKDFLYQKKQINIGLCNGDDNDYKDGYIVGVLFG